MRGKLWFVGGLAVGFVLGARAGRERYEQLVQQGRKMLDHPTVQEAAGVAQAQANRLYAESKDRLSHTRLGEKLGTNGHSAELGAGDSGSVSGSETSTSSSNSKSSKSSTSPASPSATGAKTGSSGSGTNGTTF